MSLVHKLVSFKAVLTISFGIVSWDSHIDDFEALP